MKKRTEHDPDNPSLVITAALSEFLADLRTMVGIVFRAGAVAVSSGCSVLNKIGYPNILSFASISCPSLFAHSLLFSRLGDAQSTCRHDRPRHLPH